jgi:hypothetical protein
MTTFYATNPMTGVAWSATSPVYKPPGGGIVACASGIVEIAVNPVAADVYRFCKVPRGAIVFQGWLFGDDLDTGTETLDIDIGWEANGVESADTDGFGNMGIISGDVVTEINPVASIWRPLTGTLNTAGPASFSAETWISGTTVTTAAATGTGTLTVAVLFYCR